MAKLFYEKNIVKHLQINYACILNIKKVILTILVVIFELFLCETPIDEYIVAKSVYRHFHG